MNFPIQTKFKIDDIVCMDDDLNFNPSSKMLSIGKIEAIHIQRGDDIYSRNEKGTVTHTISGCSHHPREEELTLFSEINLHECAECKKEVNNPKYGYADKSFCGKECKDPYMTRIEMMTEKERQLFQWFDTL